MKKIIGIIANADDKRYLLNKAYCKSILEAGGLPVIIPYGIKSGDILDRIDGLLFSGGGDIHSKYFNEPLDERARLISVERDEFEISFCADALKRNIPMLCICRGMQVLNVACGGSLIQHIDGHMQSEERHVSTQKITICKNSLLYDIFKLEQIYVNSFHHQALKNIGDKLIVTARYICEASIGEASCITEAVEHIDNRFVLGVQWHPEAFTSYSTDQLPLFSRFINEC